MKLTFLLFLPGNVPKATRNIKYKINKFIFVKLGDK